MTIRPPKPSHEHTPFVTGSYAYGESNEDSDIDLVLPPQPELSQFLIATSDEERGVREGGRPATSVKSGKLNLYVCKSLREYNAIKEATRQLIQRMETSGIPVTNAEATVLFDEYKESWIYANA